MARLKSLESARTNAAPPDGAGDEPSVTLAEQLFGILTEAILKGEIPLGSKISEPLLAQRYGVSRGPLREALHRLQERHLIVRSANQGARVIVPTPEMLNTIFTVREVLEGLAAREAATRMAPEEIDLLEEGVRRHEAEIAGMLPGRHNALGSADQDFHFRIAQASANPFLIDLLCNQLYPLLRLYRSRRDNQELRSKALLEHQAIVNAIRDRDPELAEFVMRRHISRAKVRRAEAMSL